MSWGQLRSKDLGGFSRFAHRAPYVSAAVARIVFVGLYTRCREDHRLATLATPSDFE
jgi:hypothetical protein